MLHITNGDSAVGRLREAGIDGTILPWRDVLHEGPVPAELDLEGLREIRAGFISSRGWETFEAAWQHMKQRDATLESFRDHDEVVLWFEHDLYDQLQLLQVLDWFAGHAVGETTLSLVCRNEYLGNMTLERVRELWPERNGVTFEQLSLARSGWAAFRSTDPTHIEAIISADTSALPFLGAALRRHLQQFPSVVNGLSRSEAQALRAVADGNLTVKDAYIASHHEQEDPIFLGDSIFAMYLADMSRGPQPLITLQNGQPIEPPAECSPQFLESSIALTDTGRAVLNNEKDWIQINGLNRWYGGVHLYGDEARWRWDEATGKLRAQAGH
jgi:hypothetical protein